MEYVLLGQRIRTARLVAGLSQEQLTKSKPGFKKHVEQETRLIYEYKDA